jgi:hypothetical protein
MRTTLLVAALASPCAAQILPIEATQSISGMVQVGPGAPVAFDLAAPDPLASWSPPPQEISAALGNSTAHMVAEYACNIGLHGLTLAAATRIDGSGDTSNPCFFEWKREFQLRFQVSSAAYYRVTGEVRRARDGWAAPIYPTSLALSAYPSPPLLPALHLIGVPAMGSPPAVASWSPRLVFLMPGQYMVAASDHSLQVVSTSSPNNFESLVTVSIDESCYADCDASGSLTIADFACFQAGFVAGDPYADCNQSGSLTIADFGCFQSQFAACP